jgi:hypothetical protein
MPKISRNSLGEYNKSCSAPHQESSKIEFEIFRIFYDFLENLQESAKSFYYWSSHFVSGPLDLFPPSQLYPRFALNTLERFGPLQSYPWSWGLHGWPESGEAGGAPGRGKGQARPRAHLGSGGGRSWGGGVAGEGARQRSAVTAAVARFNDEDDSWLGNAWVLEP